MNYRINEYYLCTENLYMNNKEIAFKKNKLYKLVKINNDNELIFESEFSKEHQVLKWKKYFIYKREFKIKRILS